MVNHLAVYRRDRGKDYIDLMLKGIKPLDIKLSTRRIAPYNYVSAGDSMYIKESSGPVVGRLKIPWVEYHEIKDPDEILYILLDIWKPVGLDSKDHAVSMYEKVAHKKYVTIFGLSDPIILDKPVRIEKSDRRVWVPNFSPGIDLKLAFGDDISEELEK